MVLLELCQDAHLKAAATLLVRLIVQDVFRMRAGRPIVARPVYKAVRLLWPIVAQPVYIVFRMRAGRPIVAQPVYKAVCLDTQSMTKSISAVGTPALPRAGNQCKYCCRGEIHGGGGCSGAHPGLRGCARAVQRAAGKWV